MAIYFHESDIYRPPKTSKCLQLFTNKTIKPVNLTRNVKKQELLVFKIYLLKLLNVFCLKKRFIIEVSKLKKMIISEIKTKEG